MIMYENFLINYHKITKVIIVKMLHNEMVSVQLLPVRVRVAVRVSFSVRGQFSSGTIVLKPMK